MVDENHEVVLHERIDTPEKIDDLVNLLKQLWIKLKNQTGKSILSAGFGFPGIFSQKEQRILQSPNYRNIEFFEIQPALAKFLEVPFLIDNDANLAAYGEYKSGAGKGAHSLVLLTLGTGVGTGIILEGNLWQGACGFAGELGHVTVNLSGEKCGCGHQGCLETEASASKIVRNYQELNDSPHVITSRDVYIQAQQGDKAAREAFASAGQFLGIGISVAINLLNPEKILLGGGLMKTGEFILAPAIEEARNRSYNAAFACCSIQKASLGNQAGFIGAASWARDRLL